MSFRTVVITKHVKCSYKNDYLVVQSDSQKMIHLSEIDAVIFDTMAFTITGVLLVELVKRKIAVVFCDESHLPNSYLYPFSAHHAASRNIFIQSQWKQSAKDHLWALIVRHKITKQAELLAKVGFQEKSDQLLSYVKQVTDNDTKNREGFAAKVYFRTLFGPKFSRDVGSPVNTMLNYGYSILLSMITREIAASGFISQIGIHHCNDSNPFNLACDLMEPFRPIVDEIVYSHQKESTLVLEVKETFWGLLQMKFLYKGMSSYLSNIIHLYVHECLNFLGQGEIGELVVYEQ